MAARTIAVKSSPGRRSQAGRVTECPRCEMEVPNLTVHLAEVHGIGHAILKDGFKQPPRLRNAAAVRRDLISCSKCNAQLAPRNVGRHMAKVHPEVSPPATRNTMASPKAPVPSPAKGRVRPEMVVCTGCGASLNPSNTGRHASKCPSRPENSRTQAQTNASPTPTRAPRHRPSSVTVCGECGAFVRKSEFQQHCAAHRNERRTHAYQSTARAHKKKRSRLVKERPVPATDYTPLDPGLSPSSRRIERALDGAREYGHAYREQGRFGSHASYDDYGEEAGA